MMKKHHLAIGAACAALAILAAASLHGRAQTAALGAELAETRAALIRLEMAQETSREDDAAMARAMTLLMRESRTAGAGAPPLRRAAMQLAQSHDSTVNSRIVFDSSQFATQQDLDDLRQELLQAIANSGGAVPDCRLLPRQGAPNGVEFAYNFYSSRATATERVTGILYEGGQYDWVQAVICDFG